MIQQNIFLKLDVTVKETILIKVLLFLKVNSFLKILRNLQSYQTYHIYLSKTLLIFPTKSMFTIFRFQMCQMSHIHIQLESTMKKDLTCTKAIYLKNGKDIFTWV